MSLIQRLVTGVLPKSWAESIKAESESWIVTCPKCGTVRSVWEIGGIRYKAVSRHKKASIYCTTCGKIRFMPMEKRRKSGYS